PKAVNHKNQRQEKTRSDKTAVQGQHVLRTIKLGESEVEPVYIGTIQPDLLRKIDIAGGKTDHLAEGMKPERKQKEENKSTGKCPGKNQCLTIFFPRHIADKTGQQPSDQAETAEHTKRGRHTNKPYPPGNQRQAKQGIVEK